MSSVGSVARRTPACLTQLAAQCTCFFFMSSRRASKSRSANRIGGAGVACFGNNLKFTFIGALFLGVLTGYGRREHFPPPPGGLELTVLTKLSIRLHTATQS